MHVITKQDANAYFLLLLAIRPLKTRWYGLAPGNTRMLCLFWTSSAHNESNLRIIPAPYQYSMGWDLDLNHSVPMLAKISYKTEILAVFHMIFLQHPFWWTHYQVSNSRSSYFT